MAADSQKERSPSQAADADESSTFDLGINRSSQDAAANAAPDIESAPPCDVGSVAQAAAAQQQSASLATVVQQAQQQVPASNNAAIPQPEEQQPQQPQPDPAPSGTH
jgi:hypothetical protein